MGFLRGSCRFTVTEQCRPIMTKHSTLLVEMDPFTPFRFGSNTAVTSAEAQQSTQRPADDFDLKVYIRVRREGILCIQNWKIYWSNHGCLLSYMGNRAPIISWNWVSQVFFKIFFY